MHGGIEAGVDTVTSAVITGGSGQSDMGKHLKEEPNIINDTDCIQSLSRGINSTSWALLLHILVK